MRFIDGVASAIAHLFYRVDHVGSPPAEGPLLLLPNHPNALLDPALVMATADRPIRFLAKSTLFQTPLRPILRAAGAIPVFRRQDQGVDATLDDPCTPPNAATQESREAGWREHGRSSCASRV